MGKWGDANGKNILVMHVDPEKPKVSEYETEAVLMNAHVKNAQYNCAGNKVCSKTHPHYNYSPLMNTKTTFDDIVGKLPSSCPKQYVLVGVLQASLKPEFHCTPGRCFHVRHWGTDMMVAA